jgi:DNA-directed RNA polymerase subunit N (RpoN/RPB10)
MTAKHAFGTPVQCVNCGQHVLAVWAETHEQAAQGQGRCDECQVRQEMQRPADDAAISKKTKTKGVAEGGD